MAWLCWSPKLQLSSESDPLCPKKGCFSRFTSEGHFFIVACIIVQVCSWIPICSKPTEKGASLTFGLSLCLGFHCYAFDHSNMAVKGTVHSFHYIFTYHCLLPLLSSKSPALPLQRLLKHSQLSYINCVVEPSAPWLTQILLSCQLLCLVRSCWASFAPWSVEPLFLVIIVVPIYIVL
jgi:hypothetical protein